MVRPVVGDGNIAAHGALGLVVCPTVGYTLAPTMAAATSDECEHVFACSLLNQIPAFEIEGPVEFKVYSASRA